MRNVRQHGSVLLIVLAVITLLAFAVATTVLTSSHYDQALANRTGLLRARGMAERGLAVAAHPIVSATDPLLEFRSKDGAEGYRAIMTTEESRLNINMLLNEANASRLEQIFQNFRLPLGAAQGLVAALMDWTDEDAVKRRPDSAEAFDYKQMGFPNRPYNRRFRSIQEIDMVAGIEKLNGAYPGWRRIFSVYGSGQIDVNEASAEVITLITGANTAMVQRLVQRRNGRDGIHHTADDQPITAPQEVMQMLGLPQNHPVASLLVIQGQTLRIESIGWYGDHAIGLAVLTQKKAAQMQILFREEFTPRR
ncbi:MAG: general secretion pathway protein GspK [Prosthecobacter sp.]